MRLDGEIDKETYTVKNNALLLEKSRTETKINAHGKADDGYNDTLLNLFDIAHNAAGIFSASKNIDKKRLLLSFLFDRLELDEGRLGYSLRFPFSEFQEITELKGSCGFDADFGGNSAGSEKALCEPQKSLKKQELKPEFKPSVQSGWGGWTRTSA